MKDSELKALLKDTQSGEPWNSSAAVVLGIGRVAVALFTELSAQEVADHKLKDAAQSVMDLTCDERGDDKTTKMQMDAAEVFALVWDKMDSEKVDPDETK